MCELTALSAQLATADTTDDRFLTGLRQRQLYALAESYCRDRLSHPHLPVRQQAELTVELSRTLAEHALQTPPAEAEPLWAQALDVPGSFTRDHAESPLAVLTQVQGALVLLARGELSRQQAEVSAAGPTLLAEARGSLRVAIRELTAADERLAEQLRSNTRAAADSLSPDQLRSLQTNVRFQLARAFRNQGQCYAAGSSDRANALVQACEFLAPLTQLDSDDSLAWPARLDEVTCLRLTGDGERAAERLEALFAAAPPADAAHLATAERIRLALDRAEMRKAIELADAVTTNEAQACPDLDLARLEVALAAWRAADEADDNQQATVWEEQAARSVESIQQVHGPYWTRRAEALLSANIAGSTTTNNLAMLTRAAEGYFRGGQLDEALAAYDRAREQAAEQKQEDEAFRLAYAAATIEHERGAHRAAADRYRELALATPKHAQAPDAHLLAIFNESQDARSRSGTSLDAYAALLDEHLNIWPDGPTASQAQWLLGKLREHQDALPQAIAAYQRVAADHSQYVAAIDGVGRCYERLLIQRQSARQPTDDMASTAARWFEGLLLGDDNRLPEKWTAADLTAALHAARIWTRYASGQAGRAERVLRPALAGADAAAPEQLPADWRSSAQCLLIAVLAAAGRIDDAREAADRLRIEENIAPAQALLDDLTRLSTAAEKDGRPALADLQTRVAKAIGGRGGELDEAGRKSLQLAQARALAAAGKRADAVAALGKLAAEHPRDGQVQEEFGRALLEAGDPVSLERALDQWRDVEKHSRPGGERWFRARYHLARTYERLGERDRAAKVITTTQAVYPELGGEELKPQFIQLLERCGRKASTPGAGRGASPR